MTILIIGGTGSTGLELARLLHAAGHPLLVTSRTGKAPEPFPAVTFDWLDNTTFQNPFSAPSVLGSPIDKVYIIGPRLLDPLPVAKPFIDLAVSKGVKQFVLIGGLLTPPGGHFYGKIHQYLIDIGVDYTVLRGGWFMKNFHMRDPYIKNDSFIFSMTGDGKIPFVATDDVAQAAFEVLTSDIHAGARDLYVIGPELLSQDEVANIFSIVLNRPITHKRVSTEEHKNLLIAVGWPAELIEILAETEKALMDGIAEKILSSSAAKTFVGKITMEQYVREHAKEWK